MINILCFGDSNTFGTNPAGGRWPLEVRWTGVLQQLLGPGYRVIEEGCGGRTTIFEDELERDKNGRAQLRVALRSHRPLDLVILMLGTNDMKHRFGMLPVDVAEPAPAEENPVAEIEENVLAAFSAQSTEEQAPTEETPAEDDYPEGDPFAEEEPLEATRRINLDDLKFGRNYSGGKD